MKAAAPDEAGVVPRQNGSEDTRADVLCGPDRAGRLRGEEDHVDAAPGPVELRAHERAGDEQIVLARDLRERARVDGDLPRRGPRKVDAEPLLEQRPVDARG